jgi:hypothetical protein
MITALFALQNLVIPKRTYITDTVRPIDIIGFARIALRILKICSNGEAINYCASVCQGDVSRGRTCQGRVKGTYTLTTFCKPRRDLRTGGTAPLSPCRPPVACSWEPWGNSSRCEILFNKICQTGLLHPVCRLLPILCRYASGGS